MPKSGPKTKNWSKKNIFFPALQKYYMSTKLLSFLTPNWVLLLIQSSDNELFLILNGYTFSFWPSGIINSFKKKRNLVSTRPIGTKSV